MPTTKPINKRLDDVFKSVRKFSQQTGKASKTTEAAEVKANKARTTALREHLHLSKQITAEVEKRVRLEEKGQRATTKGGGGSGRGLQSRIVSKLKALPGRAAGAAIGKIIGTITGQMRESIKTYTNTLTKQRDMSGFIGRPELGSLLAQSARQGFGLDESMALTGRIGRVAGSTGPGRFSAEGSVLAAQRASVQMGVGTDLSANLMGVLRQAGVTGFDEGQTGLKLFEKTLTSGMASGLEKTRVPEHMANMQKGIQMMGEVQAGVVDVAALNRTFAMLGQLGPGFQGQRGFQTFQAFQNMTTKVAQGGGSKDVQALALQDIGGFGGPGSQNSYFQALTQLEQGATPENIRNSLQGILRRYGATEEGAVALGRSTGLSMSRSKKLLQAEATGGMSSGAINSMIQQAATEAMPVDEKLLNEAKKQSENQFRIFDQGAELAGISLDISTAITRMASETTPLLKSILDGIRRFVHDTEEGIELVREALNLPVKTDREKEMTSDIRQMQQTLSGNELLDELHRKRLEFERQEVQSGDIRADFGNIQQQFTAAEEDARYDARIAAKVQADFDNRIEQQKIQRDEYRQRVAAAQERSKNEKDEEMQKSATDATKAVAKTQAVLASQAEHTGVKTASPPAAVTLSSGDTP